MESKFLLIIQMAFDLVVGALLLVLFFKGGAVGHASSPRASEQKALDQKLREWKDTGEELVAQLEAKVEGLISASEELDRAEMRAMETLERLERVRLALVSGEGAYGPVQEWIAQGVPLEEVARRSGLGIGELRLMKELSYKGSRSQR